MSDSVFNNYQNLLINGETWVGQMERINMYHGDEISCINLSCHTDQPGTVSIEFSNDNSNWDFVESHTVLGNTPFWVQIPVRGRVFRAKFLNDSGADQTFFRLHTSLLKATQNEISVSLNHEGDSIQVVQTNHDSLSCNSNLQQGNTDVGAGNKIYVQNPILEAVDYATQTTLSAINTKIPNNLTVNSNDRLDVSSYQAGDWTFGPSNVNAGTEANLYSAQACINGTNSAVFDASNWNKVAIFGNSNSSNTLKLQVSQDNTTFYDSSWSIVANGDFHLEIDSFSPKYLRLQSTGSSTVTATCGAKF